MNLYIPEPERASVLPKAFPEQDNSLNEGASSLDTAWFMSPEDFYQTFFASRPDLIYLALSHASIAIVTHPKATSTSQEKAELLNVDPSRVIKTLYFVNVDTEQIYAFVIPSTNRVDLKSSALREMLGFNPAKKLRFAAQEDLPERMSPGTCHPFISEDCTKINVIFFDQTVIEASRSRGHNDDFAITLETVVDNHQLSLQMSYAAAHDVLARKFPGKVQTF
ncbi:YbaK/EbsC family protein [Candidatus Woesearchaeota archaeon]|nr:YbaK/EbsC family protein [Candidatus Woesearchaeota archaeon]